MADHLTDLMAQLNQATAALSVHAEVYCSHVSVVIYAHEFAPEMTISRELLKQIADLGAQVDVDLYCLTDAAS